MSQIKNKFIEDDAIDVSKMTSGSATIGQVPLADGFGGVDWGNQALAPSNPTVQRFTSGSGTYTTPVGAKWLRISMVGGGGGGSGSGTASIGSGASGTASTFGTSLLTAGPGLLSPGQTISSASGGAGGSPTVNSPAITVVAVTGAKGQAGGYLQSVNSGIPEPALGGSSFFGGGGAANAGSAGGAASANSGSGGGGAGIITTAQANNFGGGGGGAGAYVEAIILTPSSSYSYAVGAGGGGGTAGTNGVAGGAGASGIIIVEEYY